ncbi:CD209 antigen-like protein E [Parambassis ranga]|uniref:CD209 antigen-like protein E n=1 Tax=Parambassis ranga TaxID=210632 RepID=A0A6P7HLL1_9TELE|nr:CD209 antigen-like protein E [Parambassis ranga]
MEDIYVNMEEAKGVSSNHTGVRSSHRRFYSAAILCLGLLSVFLLVGLITLCVHYHRVGANLNNLTERLQTSDVKLSSMTEERDRLTANLTAMNIKLQCLTAQNKHCPAGWRLFGCGCYFFSADSASWERSRQDCREKGADLVAIDSYEEQEFLTTTINQTSWIGLNDRDHEGTWKWSDGTPLDSTPAYWREDQPDNGNGDPLWGEEDCVYITAQQEAKKNWNDRKCVASHRWICEKMVLKEF